MDANELSYVISFIKSDEEHHTERRILHENYEWLEHYWRFKYAGEEASIEAFIRERGLFYWSHDIIKEFAKEFAAIECVGSNKDSRYAQTNEIARATMYLRYYCNLFENEIPTCNSICRQNKIDKGFCNKENGLLWKKYYDPVSAFKALMYIIRQVRNNLFHGHKLSLDPEQYERNKILVKLSSQVTDILLELLIESER